MGFGHIDSPLVSQNRQACPDHGQHALGQGRDADHPASAALSRLGLRPRSQGRERQGDGPAARRAQSTRCITSIRSASPASRKRASIPCRASRPTTWKPKARRWPPRCSSSAKREARSLDGVGATTARRDHPLCLCARPTFRQNKKTCRRCAGCCSATLNATLEAMLEIDDADGLLRDLAISFLETPEKEFGSIVSTAQRQTEILDNPSMIACLSASGDGRGSGFQRNGTGEP